MYFWISGAVLVVLCWPADEAWAWGATGHEWVSGIAIEQLPDDVPDFVRAPDAAAELAVLGRELDRSKGAGETHDKEHDPGHFVDLTDDGKVMGILALDKLPTTREAYDTQLRVGGSTQYKAGYLPYAIIDGWQQIRKDFAYWRAAVKGAETATNQDERAWFEADRRLREKLTPHDIGIWSHYIDDASQPLHLSVHYNGWGERPNPEGYTIRKIHAYFEGAFVRQNLGRAAVAAGMPTASARSRRKRGRSCWRVSSKSCRFTRLKRRRFPERRPARHRLRHRSARSWCAVRPGHDLRRLASQR